MQIPDKNLCMLLALDIREMELIAIDGKIWKLSHNENPDVFSAALCSLGCLGVISTVTLQCVRKFSLQQDETILTFPMALTCMDQMKKKNEFFKLLWYPHV